MILGLVPIAVLIAVLAAPMISLLYGDRWTPSTGPLRFLMILMVVRMLTGIAMDILMSTGATRWALLINTGWLVALVPALSVGAQVTATAASPSRRPSIGVFVGIPLAVLALQRIGVRLSPVARQLARPMLAGASVARRLCWPATCSVPARCYNCSSPGRSDWPSTSRSRFPRRELRTWIAAIRPATATE